MSSKKKRIRVTEIIHASTRLHELQLPEEYKFKNIIDKVMAARSNEEKNDPKGSGGYLAYRAGINGLGSTLVPDGWHRINPENVAIVCNYKLQIKISYQNVKCAATKSPPKPSSKKGEGSARVSKYSVEELLNHHKSPDQREFDFGNAPIPGTWYLMIDKEGNAEFSLVIIEDGDFIYLERILLRKVEKETSRNEKQLSLNLNGEQASRTSPISIKNR